MHFFSPSFNPFLKVGESFLLACFSMTMQLFSYSFLQQSFLYVFFFIYQLFQFSSLEITFHFSQNSTFFSPCFKTIFCFCSLPSHFNGELTYKQDSCFLFFLLLFLFLLFSSTSISFLNFTFDTNFSHVQNLQHPSPILSKHQKRLYPTPL